MAALSSSSSVASQHLSNPKGAFGRGLARRPLVVSALTPKGTLIQRDAQARVSKLLENNRKWATTQVKYDLNYFNRLKNQQNPDYLWIGCSDSRVPANVILGLDPGQVFVHRNVGNQAGLGDLNCQTCVEYSVKALGVRTIILCGHYKCGAVKAALTLPSKTPGLVNCWISDIREARNQNMPLLQGLSDEEAVAKLCELNVLRQVFHICTSSTVQEAWDKGQPLSVYGMCYSIDDGILKPLVGPLSSNARVGTDPDAFVSEAMAGSGDSLLDALLSVFTTPEPKPEPKKVDPVEVNAARVSKMLAEHAAWDQGVF